MQKNIVLCCDGTANEFAKVTLFARDGVEQKLPISPILLSEGVTSVREATRAGLGIATLPDWLIDDNLRSGRLVRVLPQWRPKSLPLRVVYAGQRPLPARVSAFIDLAVADITRALAPYTWAQPTDALRGLGSS